MSPIVQSACDNQLLSSNAGTLQDPALVEVSGIAASTRYPSTLWAHNDSGDTARLFAITDAGADRVTFTLSGATANDWEDIALGPGLYYVAPLYIYFLALCYAIAKTFTIARIIHLVPKNTATRLEVSGTVESQNSPSRMLSPITVSGVIGRNSSPRKMKQRPK